MTITAPVATALDEKTLIARAQQSETAAFVPLFSKYQKTLSHQIYKRVKNTETAKDLTQETWLKALRGIQIGIPVFFKESR